MNPKTLQIITTPSILIKRLDQTLTDFLTQRAALALAKQIHQNITSYLKPETASYSSSVCIIESETGLYGGGYFLADNPPWCISAIKIAFSVLTSSTNIGERIKRLYWYDPLGKRLLEEFALSDLIILKDFIHLKTELVDLATNDKLTVDKVFTQRFNKVVPDKSLPLVYKPRKSTILEEQIFRFKIYNSDNLPPTDDRIVALILPYLKLNVDLGYSNGIDRPARKAHSAAVLLASDGNIDVVINKNFRHSSFGFMANCAEAITIGITKSEGLLNNHNRNIDHIIVYSPDYIDKLSSSIYPPAICGTCESIIGSFSTDDLPVLVTTCSDSSTNSKKIYKPKYSELDSLVK